MGTRCFLPRSKQIGHEAPHSPQSSAEVKNEWCCISIILVCLNLLVPMSGTAVMQCDAQNAGRQVMVTTFNSHPYTAFIKFWSSAAPTEHVILAAKD